ncbi:Methyltransferase domain-containing protein [Anaerovirgula multivorans]|uniref:Methyltransferase domain-containing protein n=1 Tax=Anaerovirgula multivorans TaxID=312168 RepID=A0A239GSQ6_9FIRM|nr:methyltransferase domain-containing protein [Anaerovirgula multivorans]SNS72249.1 Methyltransferase domain-containing protein [Anaerovirgula multivorans]
MKDVEERLAKSLTAETIDLIPYLPYLLQDLWELGSKPEDIIELINKNVQVKTELKILDLACGKGAVSIKLAKEIRCNVNGIDIIPEFISYAEQKAKEFEVQDLCRFIIEDINLSVTKEQGYDIVILGAVGEVLGAPEITIQKLKNTIKPGGFIIIDDAYSREDVTSNYLSYKQWLKIFKKTSIQLIEEKPASEDEMSDINDKNNQCIINRANELKKKYPDKATLFESYINSQLAECDELENEIIAVTWMLKKI